MVAVAGVNEVSLEWSPPQNADLAGVTWYAVRVTPGDRVEWTAADRPRLDVTGLRNGVDYAFAVYAVSDAGSSEPSDEVHATPVTGA